MTLPADHDDPLEDARQDAHTATDTEAHEDADTDAPAWSDPSELAGSGPLVRLEEHREQRKWRMQFHVFYGLVCLLAVVIGSLIIGCGVHAISEDFAKEVVWAAVPTLIVALGSAATAIFATGRRHGDS